MRARSGYLLTSWWVVGVWVSLSILTGVISIISVLQPTWYVRYTLVHAQTIKDVTFQVVVSSVGPLGYCRLLSVETRKVIDDLYATSILKHGITTTSNLPDHNLFTTEASKTSVNPSENPMDPNNSESLPDKSAENIVETQKSPKQSENIPMETRNAREQLENIPGESGTPMVIISPTDSTMVFQNGSSDQKLYTTATVSLLEEFTFTSNSSFKDSLIDGDSEASHLLDTAIPTDNYNEIIYDGRSDIDDSDYEKGSEDNDRFDDNLFLGLNTYPEYPIENEGDNKSDIFVVKGSRNSGTYPNRDNNVDDRSDGIKDLLYSVTQEYMRNVYEESEQLLDKEESKDTNYTNNSFKEGVMNKEILSSNKEHQINIEKEVVDGLKFLKENETDRGNVNIRYTGKSNRKSYLRKRNRKNTKRKKNKMKRRLRKKSKLQMSKPSQISDLSSKNFPYEMNYLVISPTSSSGLNPNLVMNLTEDEITSQFLIQQEKQTIIEGKSIDFDYIPRLPILACSGVTMGVGSGSSAVWALVGVAYGVAGVIQLLVGVLSILSQAVRSPTRRYTHALMVGNIQVAVVMSQGVSLVLFPLGLGSPLARVECGGSSSVYWSGDCTFGWAYMLAIVATTLAAYCPFLARLTVYKRYADREWESMNFF